MFVDKTNHHHSCAHSPHRLSVRLAHLTGSLLQRNAAFHSSPSFIRTLLKPQRTSNLVKYLAPRSWVINLDQGEGVLVFNGHRIESSIVLHESQPSTLLFDEEDRGRHRGFGWSDASRLEVLL